jgi:hypothetical protein
MKLRDLLKHFAAFEQVCAQATPGRLHKSIAASA